MPPPSGSSQMTDTPLPAKSGSGAWLAAARSPPGDMRRAVDVIASGCNDADWLRVVQPAEETAGNTRSGCDAEACAQDEESTAGTPRKASAEVIVC